MCIYTKQKKAKRAIFPKIRYKVLCIDSITKKYMTPYQWLEVTPNFNRVLKADYFNTFSDIGILDWDKRIVNHGIHTFKTKKAAKRETTHWLRDTFIFKVIIPIGTYYFDGEFNNLNDASCSEKIRFIKEINNKL